MISVAQLTYSDNFLSCSMEVGFFSLFLVSSKTLNGLVHDWYGMQGCATQRERFAGARPPSRQPTVGMSDNHQTHQHWFTGYHQYISISFSSSMSCIGLGSKTKLQWEFNGEKGKTLLNCHPHPFGHCPTHCVQEQYLTHFKPWLFFNVKTVLSVYMS